MSDQPRLRRPVAILCDIGNTLLEERRFDLEAGLREVVLEPERVIDELAASFRQELVKLHESRKEVLLVEWLGQTGCRIVDGTYSEIEDRIWRKIVDLVPMPRVGRALEHLRRERVVLGAVSNAYFSARVVAREMETHRILHHFQFVITSGDMGVRKPDPAIFREGIRQAGTGVRETWFVGDTYKEDIVGAASIGLHPVRIGGERLSAPPSFETVVQDWKEFMSLIERL